MTLEEMKQQFPESAQEEFEKTYKAVVDRALKKGLKIEEANRFAFDLLIKEGKFVEILEAMRS